MKKRILLSMFSISLLVGTLPMNLVASGVEESIISTEYQEDGDIYYETVLDKCLPMPEAARRVEAKR